MTDISLHGPLAVQPQFAAAGEQPPQAGQGNPPVRQQVASPNLRIACPRGDTYVPKGTDLNALFGNNNRPA